MELTEATAIFGALANEHRVRIVRQLLDKAMQCTDPDTCDLSESCCDVGELAANLNIAPPTVSYHLKELKYAGLIAAHRRGRRLYYEVQTDRLHEAIACVWPASIDADASVQPEPQGGAAESIG